MRRSRPLSSLVLLAALTATSFGQIAHVATGLPGLTFGANLPTAAYPIGAPDPLSPMPAPAMGALPPALFPAGGIAINEPAGILYATDGFLITQDPLTRYLPFTPGPIPLPGPFPLPPTPGPVTGLGYAAATGLLWFCTPGAVGAFAAAPPFPIAVPPVPIPLPAVAGPLTGIGVEAVSGTLYLSTAAGLILHHGVGPGIPPIGPQPVAVAASPLGLPIVGCDVNDSNGPGTFPPFACSTQIIGDHVIVTDGAFVIDAIPGTVPPIPVGAPVGIAGASGLAYSNDFQITFGKAPGGCLSSGATLLAGMRKPTFVGPGGLNAFRLAGAPPFSTCLMLADLCPLPGGAMLGLGEILWINPLSPTFASFTALADAAGNASLPVSFIPAPGGIQVSVQWGVPDALHPLGYCLSDLCTITTGMP